MNKDVIYIKEGDDLANIISKIENAARRIVALVPPKEAEILENLENVEKIAESGKKVEKVIVFITENEEIIKVAAKAHVLVTKDLQTAPAYPKEEESSAPSEQDDAKESEPSDKEDDKKSEKEAKKIEVKDEKDIEEKKEAKEKKETAFSQFMKKYKWMVIAGGMLIVVMIVFLIWAFVIAPSVTVTVEVKTTKNNFSENITFTSKLEEENTSEGKFFLDEKKKDTVLEESVTATGKKNTGEKATGEVVVSAYFKEKGSKEFGSGTSFTISGLNYLADEKFSVGWDGKDATACDNDATEMIEKGCLVSERVKVTAEEAGTKYNINASKTGWKESSGTISVASDSEMSGGTDKTITVVQESDIEKIKEKILKNATNNQETLFESIGDSSLIIDSTYTQEITNVVATPAVGEEVKEGVKPTVKITLTAKVYALDEVKIEEFITSKAKLEEGYKIYSINDPFIENFMEATTGYVGKLKTSYTTGAKITENEIVEKILGKGIGDTMHDLKNIEGVSNVKIDTSYPWVNSVPNDTNKVFVNLDVVEAN